MLPRDRKVKTAEVGVETAQEPPRKTTQKSSEEIDPNRQAVGLDVGLDGWILNEVTARSFRSETDVAGISMVHISKLIGLNAKYGQKVW